MALFNGMASNNAEIKSQSKRAYTSGTALSALLAGLSTTFGLRRAFQFPLWDLSGGTIVVVCLVGGLSQKLSPIRGH
jgi:hypothetical protein